MGAPRWTEAPKLVRFDPAARTLEIDPGGGWTTDDGGNDATEFLVNLAQNGRVVWGNDKDYGPGGGAGLTTPAGVLVPGQFNESQVPSIPLPDAGGSFDVQVWGGFYNRALGVIEWGRVNSFDQPAFVRNIQVPAKGGPPPPPPPSDEEALVKAARDATRALVMHLRSEGLTWAQVKAHPFGHAYYTDLGGK